MRELKIIQSKSYLTMMAARTNRENHQEQLDNCYDQINYLEIWRRKAIILINQQNKRNVEMELSTRESESKALKSISAISLLEQEVNALREQVERLTNNIVI